MNCQKCDSKLLIANQPFCHVCGWDLKKEYPPEPVKPEVDLSMACPACHKLIPDMRRTIICPFCRVYLADNKDRINPKLIETAKNWTGRTKEFCLKILKVNVRTANRFHFYEFSPIEVLAIHPERFLAMRSLGEKHLDEFENARYNWKPVEEKGE